MAHCFLSFNERKWLRALSSTPSARCRIFFCFPEIERRNFDAWLAITSGMRAAALGRSGSPVCSTLRTRPWKNLTILALENRRMPWLVVVPPSRHLTSAKRATAAVASSC